MTLEDKDAQKLVQADLVARREELDLILHEQSRNIYGHEFVIYLKLGNFPNDTSL